MLFCFLCLIENRESANKAVTYVQGTCVCQEHLTSVGGADILSLSYKLKDGLQALRTKAEQNRE